jgi:predicted O-methyltransferase YrrM
MKDALFPAGHFYSPVPDVEDLARRREALWPANPEVAYIDLNDSHHQRIIEEYLPRYTESFDYPAEGPEDEQLEGFYVNNSQFSNLDCRLLFCLLQEWRPRRVIEVGGGYSTLLTADVNHRFLGGAIHFTCIEPYPRTFLERPLDGLTELLVQRVEEVPLARFDALGTGDILFIDSSHVCKTGSDVNYLYFEVIPRLKPGVRVHVHDIFLPAEYPPDWVLEDNRSWNEQYLLRAMLTHNPRYRVLFGCMYAAMRFPQAIQVALGLPEGTTAGGGSFWFEVIGQ